MLIGGAIKGAWKAGRSAMDVAFTSDERGRTLGNLFTGQRMNHVVEAGLVLGGVTIAASSIDTDLLKSQAREDTYNAMPALGYSGRDLKDYDLGTSGELAIALHHNRHGR